MSEKSKMIPIPAITATPLDTLASSSSSNSNSNGDLEEKPASEGVAQEHSDHRDTMSNLGDSNTNDNRINTSVDVAIDNPTSNNHPIVIDLCEDDTEDSKKDNNTNGIINEPTSYTIDAIRGNNSEGIDWRRGLSNNKTIAKTTTTTTLVLDYNPESGEPIQTTEDYFRLWKTLRGPNKSLMAPNDINNPIDLEHNVHAQTTLAAEARQRLLEGQQQQQQQPSPTTPTTSHGTSFITTLDNRMNIQFRPTSFASTHPTMNSTSKRIMPTNVPLVQHWRSNDPNNPTSVVIDLTDTDDLLPSPSPSSSSTSSVTAASSDGLAFKSTTNRSGMDAERCYGMLMSTIQPYTRQVGVIQPRFDQVTVEVTMKTFNSTTQCEEETRIGKVNLPEGRFLANVLYGNYARFEAIIPATSWIQPDCITLLVVVYAHTTALPFLTVYLRDTRLNLIKPNTWDSNIVYDGSCARINGRPALPASMPRSIQPRSSLGYGTAPSQEGASPAIMQQLAYGYPSSNYRETSNTPSSWDIRTTSQSVQGELDEFLTDLSGYEDLPETEPDTRLIATLYRHQRQALTFMLLREKDERLTINGQREPAGLWRPRTRPGYRTCYVSAVTSLPLHTQPPPVFGGLLADDMGLGKTITAISLILSTLDESRDERRKTDPLAGGTLIICPLSVISNWDEQIVTHVVPKTLSVYVHHGISRVEDVASLAGFDVVITTFNLVSLHYSKAVKMAKQANNNSNGNNSSNNSSNGQAIEIVPTGLQQIKWFRVILDEAHIIKEPKTMLCRSVCNFQAERRWCLTGTPIQNRLTDLYSLIKYLRVTPFDDFGHWRQLFITPIQRGHPEAMRRLQILLKYLTLRRTKTTKVNGRPLLDLPEKEDRRIWLEWSASEQALYEKWAALAKESVAEQKMNISHILELLLRLRQVCVHPALCKDIQVTTDENDSSTDNAQAETDEVRAARILELLRSIVTDLPGVSKCQHLFCRTCIEDLSKTTTNTPIACPSCQSMFVITELVTAVDMDIINGQKTTDVASTTNVDSTKLNVLLANLCEARVKSDNSIKSVVFSQWTKALDLIAVNSMELSNYCYQFKFVRLDGTMRREERTKALQQFSQNPEVTIVLISLRAGGVGLNLTMAQHVYLMEPYWNPAVEQQAIDRIHRLGQTKPVVVTRLLIKNSVEDRIIKLQEYKQNIAQISLSHTLSREELKEQKREELRRLFQ
ncbi:SNF2 family N-terminal domain-containing protein [Syncephalis fuscata]|nr:SNF2 family N-terminal domain-containing protein [Syncephalis fuscata]